MKHLPRHIIGGIALTNGVLMHTPDAAVMGIRGTDGHVYTKSWTLPDKKPAHFWLMWPGIRGLWLLCRTILWNSRVRAVADSISKDLQKSHGGKGLSTPGHAPSSLFPSLGILAAFLLYATVILSINAYFDLMNGNFDMAQSTILVVLFTFVILVVLVRRAGIWTYMAYHGALHQAINGFENGHLSHHAIKNTWPWQARCGVSVVAYVALALIISGVFWTNVSFWQSILLALVFFSVSYEIVQFLDKYSDTWWAKVFLAPAVVMQFLVARHPSKEHSEVASHVLFELEHFSKDMKQHHSEPLLT